MKISNFFKRKKNKIKDNNLSFNAFDIHDADYSSCVAEKLYNAVDISPNELIKSYFKETNIAENPIIGDTASTEVDLSAILRNYSIDLNVISQKKYYNGISGRAGRTSEYSGTITTSSTCYDEDYIKSFKLPWGELNVNVIPNIFRLYINLEIDPKYLFPNSQSDDAILTIGEYKTKIQKINTEYYLSEHIISEPNIISIHRQKYHIVYDNISESINKSPILDCDITADCMLRKFTDIRVRAPITISSEYELISFIESKLLLNIKKRITDDFEEEIKILESILPFKKFYDNINEDVIKDSFVYLFDLVCNAEVCFVDYNDGYTVTLPMCNDQRISEYKMLYKFDDRFNRILFEMTEGINHLKEFGGEFKSNIKFSDDIVIYIKPITSLNDEDDYEEDDYYMEPFE